MESATTSWSSCWCCTECIQSRLDRRQSAAAASAANDDDNDDDDDDADGERSAYNGLIQTDEPCAAPLLCTSDLPVTTESDVTSCEDMYLVCLSLCANIVNKWPN